MESTQAEISIADSVSVFDVTEDGLLVFGGSDGRAELQDLGLAKAPISWEAHTAPLNLVAAHRQEASTYVATADTRGTLKLWTVQNDVARLVHEFVQVLGIWARQRTEINLPAAFSKNGNSLFVADQENTVCVFDVPSKELQFRLLGHDDTVLDIAVSDDGQRFATGSFDNTVRLWTRLADGGSYSSTLLEGHSASVRGVRFLSDGATLISGAGDGTVKLWDLHMKPHRERMTLSVGNIVNSVCLLRDHEILVGKSRNQFEILSLPAEDRVLRSLKLVDSYINSNAR